MWDQHAPSEQAHAVVDRGSWSQPLHRGGKTFGCIGRRAPPLLAGRLVRREARLAPKHEDRTGIGGALGKRGAASMRNSPVVRSAWLAVACVAISVPALAHSFPVQCPATATLHPGDRSPADTAAGSEPRA